MVFGLTIGTDRATALQQSIQDELMTRGYSPDADPVMAEYITIMIINNKTPAQITSELEDLIGPDFDASFTKWLFEEAAKGSVEVDASIVDVPSSESPERPTESVPPQPTNDPSRRNPAAPRNGVYHQAISQVLPSSSSPSSHKRPASGRSPSPNHPNKMRRTDVPTGPRAMQRDGVPTGANPRSLLERVGGPPVGGQDDIQARIDNITNNGDPNMMIPGAFPPGMNGVDINAMAGMANPMMIQELMMNQMALMAHFTGMMGPGQFGGGGFPMQGMPQDLAMMQQQQQQQNPAMNGFNGQQSGGAVRGRGGGRGARGTGRGRGGPPSLASARVEEVPAEPAPVAAPVPIPAPVNPTPVAETTLAARPAYAVPERPQSPTLCKFGLKCTNAHCRWSHPSPVATVESGVVLSNDPCENGKDCKDKDCIKAHVSPATLKPQDSTATPTPSHTPSFPPSNPVPCRFGAACTRSNCAFAHPSRTSNLQCRFGAACTRATCQYQHPPGRVLPTSFHRGVTENGPMVTVKNPETGSMGGPSPHRSATFNKPSALKEKLEKQMKEIEERKSQAEKAVRDAQAKKGDAKSVEITA